MEKVPGTQYQVIPIPEFFFLCNMNWCFLLLHSTCVIPNTKPMGFVRPVAQTVLLCVHFFLSKRAPHASCLMLVNCGAPNGESVELFHASEAQGSLSGG